MKKNRQHHNKQFIRFFKYVFAAFAFISPIFFVLLVLPKWFTYPELLFKNLLVFIPPIIFTQICILLAAYFYTDLEVDENGLMIEFLWKRLQVPWSKVIQIKPLFGIKLRKQGIYVVIVDGLTPFHRLYGLLYGFSLKPSFVLWSTVSDFKVLKNDIEKHVKKNLKTNP